MSNIDVLLVDDSREKIEALLKVLVAAGIERSSIDVALNGLDARERLRGRLYAVLILDLAIPRRPEDQATPDGGIELLNEIFDRGGYHIPRSIVTVTAHDELIDRFREILDDRLIHLVRYDISTDKWQRQLARFVSDFRKISAATVIRTYETDICILTALRVPELRAVRDLEYGFEAALQLDPGILYYSGNVSIGNSPRSVVASSCPRMGPVAAGIHTTRMIDNFRPRMVVMSGICAGLKGATEFGDVILAMPSWDWQSGKRTAARGRAPSGAFQIQPHQVDIDARVVAAFERVAEDSAALAGIADRWRGPKPRSLPRVLIGPVASGASVVADGDTIEEVKKTQHRKLLGLDMESYAVYAAAQDSAPPRPIFFSAKGVCDHADSKKSDDYQGYAAYMSAQVIALVLERAGLSLLG